MIFYVVFILLLILTLGRYSIYGRPAIPISARYFLACFFVMITAVFRFNIGYDWSNYYAALYPVFLEKIINKRFEFLPRCIYYIANYFNQPMLFFVIFGLITYTLIFSTIKKYSVSVYESFMIYICMFLLISFSIMRQAAATAILFWGYKYIRGKKPFHYILTCVAAFLFHKSAVIGLVLYPLYYMPFIITFLLTVLVLALYRMAFGIIANLFPMYAGYLLVLSNNGSNLIRYAYILLVLASLVFAILTRTLRKCLGFFNITSFGSIFPFLIGSAMGERLGQYFLIYVVLLVPQAIHKINVRFRILAMIMFYAYFFIYLAVTAYASKSTEYVPYRFYFLTDTSRL